MFSRAVTVAAVVMLALALVGGSAYILLNEAGEGLSRQAHADAGSAGHRGGQAELHGTGNHAGTGQSNGGSGRSAASSAGQYGQGRGQSTTSEDADHPLETWMTVTGRVVASGGGNLTAQTAEGLLTINLGPEWYVEGTGFALQAGDEVEISGFDEDGTFQVTRIANQTSGETLLLRDETGRPLWAGRGRGDKQS